MYTTASERRDRRSRSGSRSTNGLESTDDESASLYEEVRVAWREERITVAFVVAAVVVVVVVLIIGTIGLLQVSVGLWFRE